jgi:hypothetical protein
MEGDVGVSDDATFSRLVSAVKPILDACGSAIKIIVLPLPRYLYTGCCANKHHCTNLKDPDYELTLLQATMHFRPLLKDAFLLAGLDRFFVLDGIGALLGIPAGNNRGAAAEILRELNSYCANDGVHFNELGYANLAKVISSAVTGMESGSLTKADTGPENFSGKKRSSSFFWRGFTSPTGYSGPRNSTSSAAVGPPGSQRAALGQRAVHGQESEQSNVPGFTRGGTRGGSHRGYSLGRHRKLPYWKRIN